MVQIWAFLESIMATMEAKLATMQSWLLCSTKILSKLNSIRTSHRIRFTSSSSSSNSSNSNSSNSSRSINPSISSRIRI